MATDKSEKLMNPKGVEECAHSASSTKKRCLTKKYEQCSEDRNDSERDVLLDEDEDIDKEKSIVDEGRSPVVSSSLNNAKDTIEENSANKEHFGDQDRPPSQKKLAVEGKSSESDPIILLRKLKKSCDKRWNTLIEKHKKECQEIEQVCKDDISKLENDKKLHATIIRAIYGKSSTAIDKLYLLDVAFAKNMEEVTLQKDMKLKDIEARHQAERNKEKQKVADWLSDAEAYVPSKHSDCCKSQSELRTHMVGAEDVKPLIQHGVNTDSSTIVQGKHIVQSNNSECATAERLACILTNGIPSSASNSIKKGGIAVTDTLISAVVEQMNQPKHLHTGESTCAKLPVSGERGPDEMQSHELHEDIPSELHETVANEIVDNANPVNMNTNTPTTILGFGGGNAIKLSHTENFSTGEIITEESVPGDVQSFELVGDVPADLPETVASEIVDDANPVDLSTSTSIEGSGEGDAIDLPEAEQLTKPKHFGSAERILANPLALGGRVNSELQLLELHKYIPAESAETVDVEFVDNVNPVELSANTSTEGFGEEGTSHLPDAFLNQKNETDATNIDDLDLVGQVLQTSDQTKASQHPSTLLPLRIQEDEDAVSAELQDHAVEMVGKAISSLSKVITPEVVDTATNSLSNIQPQYPMEPELENRSSSRTAISTSKIIDTVIVEQSSMKLQDQETSVVKDQVTSVIELVDSERVDTAAPVATSELVGTAKSLQSDNGLQDQVEPAIETQSAPWVEVAFSENQNHTLPVLSSTEQQDEDTLIVENQLSLEIEVSNVGVADNAAPLQSRIDTPPSGSDEQLQFMPIEAFPSCNQLPPPEPELEMLSHICTAQLIEDLQQLNCVGAETQSFHNNVAAEGLLSTTGVPLRQLENTSRLPSHEVDARTSPFMLLDPFQTELEKISKGIEELKKSHEDTVSVLKSDYVKEIEKLTAKIKNKYQLKYEGARAQFGQKSNELNQNLKKLMMNKKLADAFKLKGSSNLEQYHQHLARPAGATPLNPQITGQNGQGVQQMLVPPSTVVVPFTSHPFPSQSYTAPPVQVVPTQAQHAASVYRQLRAINGVHPASNTCIPRSGENIPSSSPCIQSFVPPAAPSISTAALFSAFQNMLQPQQQRQLQLQLQQQYLATQWPSSTQNPRHLGYHSTLSHAYQSALGLQQHHNQLPRRQPEVLWRSNYCHQLMRR